MIDEQINIAIAMACGITHRNQYGTLYRTKDGWEYNCPDYCNDLNAMHEAEKTILKNYQIWTAYYYNIAAGTQLTAHATARKKAEAFLRALGKWEEVQA